MKRRFAAVAGLTFAALAAASAPASANYYAYAYMYGANQHGTDVTIRSNVLNVPSLTTDFADNDSWVIGGANYAYWVEAGVIHGTYCCNNYAASPSFFWADNRPNGGGFHSHQGGSANMNTYYDDNINWGGGGTWYVTVGTFSGTSRSNFESDSLVETGTEVTTTSATVCSSQSSLAWYDGAGGYHSGWQDATFGQAVISANNPPYGYWVSRPHWLRDYDHASC